MLSDRLEKAVRDLRYLLNRGYPCSSAVEFVSDHYELVSDDRHLLTRCVFSKDEIENHKRSLIPFEKVKDRNLGIDGYNVLITVESILEGEKVVKCDDGFVRDLQAIFGKYKISDSTERSVDKILNVLDDLKPKKVVFFFDKQVSKSGELSGFVRRKLETMDFEGDARTAEGVDKEVWNFDVSASSDRIIIERSEKVLDLPALFLRRVEGNLLDLTSV